MNNYGNQGKLPPNKIARYVNNSSIFLTGSLTNISPDQTMVGYPLVDEEIFIYDFIEDKIYLVSEQRTLEEFSDDRGLYMRVRNPLWRKFYRSVEGLDIWGFVFMCPKFGNTQRFKVYSVYNKIVVCDLLGKDGGFKDPYESRGIMAEFLSPDLFDLLPFEIFSFREIGTFYSKEKDLVSWGEPLSQNGLIVRPMKSDDPPYYILYDPFCVWQPPKYLEEMDLLEMSGDIQDIAAVIDSLSSTMNWDLIEGTIPVDRRGDLDWITSILFDKLYFQDLYYTISKALWLEDDREDPLGVELRGRSASEVLVDFRLLKRELRKRIREKLMLDGDDSRRNLLQDSPPTDLIDSSEEPNHNLISDIFENFPEEDE